MDNTNTIRSLALDTLGRALDLRIEDILLILENPEYEIFSIPKKSGGSRTIHAPIGKTKELQKKVYRNFLRKIYTGNSISTHCFGGIPKKSTKHCISSHNFLASQFVVDVDIKDAFHCVTEKALYHALKQLFYQEMFLYKFRYRFYLGKECAKTENWEIFSEKEEVFRLDKLYGEYMDKELNSWNDEYKFLKSNQQILFPNKRCKSFRSMAREVSTIDTMYQVCETMALILAKLLTFKGRLVQGCPTSPILMALVLSHTGVIEKFQSFSEFYRYPSYPESFTGISVYVDNITISVPFASSKESLSQSLRELITELHETTIWKFNWDKIHIYETLKENPLLVGVRLVRNRKTRQELKFMTSARIKGARHCLKAWEPWHYLKPTLPKTLQRKIRSVIHNAIISKDDDFLIHQRALGYIGYVYDIYENRKDIPKQISKPIEAYQAKFGVLKTERSR